MLEQSGSYQFASKPRKQKVGLWLALYENRDGSFSIHLVDTHEIVHFRLLLVSSAYFFSSAAGATPATFELRTEGIHQAREVLKKEYIYINANDFLLYSKHRPIRPSDFRQVLAAVRAEE